MQNLEALKIEHSDIVRELKRFNAHVNSLAQRAMSLEAEIGRLEQAMSQTQEKANDHEHPAAVV